MFKTPILLLVFKREDTTKRVFDQIKKIKPKDLYIVADGPRNDQEKINTDKVRAIFNDIDWECNFHKNFSEKNLGCKNRVSSGITWFFENVEKGIILEDDTLPHLSFFNYCEEMLNKYENDYQVLHINGSNFLSKQKKSNTYRFSHLFNIWGWATWRRAWNLYDIDLNGYNFICKHKELSYQFPNNYKYFMPLLKDVYEGKNNTWDVQWAISCHMNMGISVEPNTNLITNIGFGEDGTHTFHEKGKSIKTSEGFNFPIEHPKDRFIDIKLDDKVAGFSHN